MQKKNNRMENDKENSAGTRIAIFISNRFGRGELLSGNEYSS
jgi:hypothetical protein